MTNYMDAADWVLCSCNFGGGYFHSCSTANGFSNAGTPGNTWGYEEPFDGEAYMATITFIRNMEGTYRYYLSTPLIEPLVPGVEYCFTLHASLAEVSAYRTTDLHVIFTTYYPTACNGNDTLNWITEAQLVLNTTDVDTASWTELSGSFVAMAAEEYLTIGDFNAPATPDTIYIAPTTFPSERAIYYIDKLELRTCESAVHEASADELLVAYDAAAGVLNLSTSAATPFTYVALFDPAGRVVLNEPTNGTTVRLSTGRLPRGMYVVQAEIHGALHNRRVVLY
ncbi:MAG: T9SS type A sorting domain-containing protein [Flavobacteriales bacterium]|nr:T9SS type A sorting domain-containing protein [Flavobacteriales bacterium]